MDKVDLWFLIQIYLDTITCGETVEINSLDARIWLAIVLEDVENYEQDSFEDYSGQLKLSFRKKCRDDENKFIVHKK